MKKVWILAAFAVAMTSFAGCSNDDEPTGVDKSPIVGSYKGAVTMATMPVVPSATIQVADAGVENQVNLVVKETISIPAGVAPQFPDGMTIPLDITCPCAVKLYDAAYSINGSVNTTIQGMGDMTITIGGTITGNAMTINMSAGLIPLVFTGVKQ